jgi:NAD(P)-dependent dehydrogenase (short-subunit alcohol dehydrogenase family)
MSRGSPGSFTLLVERAAWASGRLVDDRSKVVQHRDARRGLLGSVVIAMSSGAAVMGSPTSGGYAGANATVRFISAYAAEESERAGLGIRFVSVLPKLTATAVGAAGVIAYAARYAKGDVAAYLDQLGPTLTPEQVGDAVAGLAADSSLDQLAYMLTPGGLIPAK